MKDADDRPGKPGRKPERFKLKGDWKASIRKFFRRQDRAKKSQSKQ